MVTKNNFSHYQFVTAMHGSEYMPTLALASLDVPQIVANPRALAQRKRYVDSDLNKAFGVEPKDYETARAQELLSLIPQDATLVDFHSFAAPSPAFVIIVGPRMIDLAYASGVQRIVYMKVSPKDGHALINHRQGISIETGQNGTEESFNTTCAVVDALQGVSSLREDGHELFEVYGKITEAGTYRNFELCRDEKEEYYPILTGQTDYDFYGLKAKRVDDFL